MNKTTKGALAAAAAAALLLGGAGTLAYWTDGGTITGTTITSGHLTVDTTDCDAGTLVWTLEGDPFDPVADTLIPGDTLEGTCDIDVDVEGTHFTQVDIDATTPSGAVGAAPWDELTVAATVNGSTTGGDNVTVNQGSNDIPVVITVTWPYGTEDNDLNGDLSTALDDIEVTVTQDHQDDAN